MGKWAQRLAAEIAHAPMAGTDKTDTRGVASVLTVDPMRDFEESRGADPAELPTALPPVPSARIYRLTREQADEAHAEPWNHDGIAMFTLRRDAFRRRGYSPDNADDLAEKLVRRDAAGDHRRMCVECTHFGDHGRCMAAAAGRLPGADRRLEPDPVILQRCPAFGLRKGLP